MPSIDSVISTLQTIRTKVRRLTRTPSENQLSNTDIDTYVNTFILYDFPEHLRQFSLRTVLTFWTEPYIDVYSTVNIPETSPLFNFNNKYISVHDPVFIAGYQVFFSQSRSQFYGIYPYVNSIASIGTVGNGVTTAFTGNVNPNLVAPISSGTVQQTVLLRNNVLFSSVDINGNGLALIDDPVNATTGNLIIPNDTTVSYGTINYVTGNFTLTFPAAPGVGQPINSQTVPQVTSLPQALLFYDDQFTVRPIPNQPYRIDIEAYIRPTELLGANDTPEIAQWSQYISYGAAKKVFEDRMDTDSVAQIMPEFKKQELLVLRKTIVQNTNERTSTIYTEQTNMGTGGYGGFGSGLI